MAGRSFFLRLSLDDMISPLRLRSQSRLAGGGGRVLSLIVRIPICSDNGSELRGGYLGNHLVGANLAIRREFARRPILEEQLAERVEQNLYVYGQRMIAGVEELESQFSRANQFFVSLFRVRAAF